MTLSLPATLLLTGVVLQSSCAIAELDCRYEDERFAETDAAGVEEVVIEAAAGSLLVEGRDGTTDVRASGTACASREAYLDDITLDVHRDGNRVLVVVDIVPRERRGTRRLDLEVEVPDGVLLDVVDSSGPLEIRGGRGLKLRDSSGSVEISRVRGDVWVDDGSGELDIADVDGAVEIRDGSGDVYVSRVGSVRIEDDGSGDLEVRSVAADVVILDDGSGDIRVEDVGGDLEIDDAGSGHVDYRDIDGRVRVKDD